MNSLASLAQIYIYSCWIIVAILLVLLVYRSYVSLRKATSRQPLFAEKGKWYPKTIKILFGFAMLCIAISLPYYAYIGSAFKSIIPAYLNHLLVLIAMWLALYEVLLTFSISEKLLRSVWKKVVLTLLVVLLLPISLLLLTEVPGFFAFPDEEDCYLIDLPVRDTWLAGHAGASEGLNVHNFLNAQQYAIDIVKVNQQGQFFEDSGNALTHFYTYNAPIYAPVEGKVVEMVDTLPNAPISLAPNEPNTPAGNHVVIEFEPDRYLFLAHLNPGTIEVEKGDYVRVGDLIGKAGNSGNSSWPHLHLHIQDKPMISNDSTQGYPFRFRNMERKRWLSWEETKKSFLIRNDFFRDIISR
jgi:hypothetical protein